MKTLTSRLLLGNPNIQVYRDINRRILHNLYERNRRVLLFDRSNLTLHLSTRLLAQQKLINLTGSKTQIHNRCMLTGRSRGNYRYFKLSRIMIKELASYGLLAGVQKSVW